MYVRMLDPCMHSQTTTCTSADGVATCLPVHTTDRFGGIVWKEATFKALHSVSG